MKKIINLALALSAVSAVAFSFNQDVAYANEITTPIVQVTEHGSPYKTVYSDVYGESSNLNQTVGAIEPRIKIAILPYKTEAYFNRPNDNYPWYLVSETVYSTVEVYYNNSWRTEYRLDSVTEYGPSETQQYPKIMRFENRTYKYSSI